MKPDQVPEEFVIESDGTIIDPSVLKFATLQQRAMGKSGRAKCMIFSQRTLYQAHAPKRYNVFAEDPL